MSTPTDSKLKKNNQSLINSLNAMNLFLLSTTSSTIISKINFVINFF